MRSIFLGRNFRLSSPDEFKYAVEALLFASERPLSVTEIAQAFSAEGGSAFGGDSDLGDAKIRETLNELKSDYLSQRRGFRLLEIAGGFQLVSDPRFAETLKKFYQSRIKKRLTQASLETLSVIAYRQPVTRADVEFIRGVNIDGALKSLLEKNLVRISGRKDVPGRPMLYGTTRQFLEHFGLNSLEDLPALKNYSEKDLDPALIPPGMRTTEAGESTVANDETQNGADPNER